MTPYELLGLPYRLGADPERHNAADCLSLACAVLRHYGFEPPVPERSWYRRLRKGDTQVFRDELERYCLQVDEPKTGVIALCPSPLGFGLAAYFEGGWLCFVESAVRWRPIEGQPVVQLYCLTKQL